MIKEEVHEYALKRAADFLDSWLSLRAGQVDLPGFSIAVGYKDKVIFQGAYGLADIERGERLTPKHLFSISSQSKMLTATAVMQLVEQHKLALDGVVITYLPWLAQHRDKRHRDITLRQLLAHSSGMVRDGLDGDYWQLQRLFPNGQELQQAVLAADLAFDPDETLKYSNLGYGLLGQVIEAVTSTPYVEYVDRHIVKPFGLALTTVPTVPVATGYTAPLNHHRQSNPMPIQTQALDPAVGWYSTAADMCRFAYMHIAGPKSPLSKKSRQEMHRNHPRQQMPQAYQHLEYGLGFQRLQLGGRLFLGHSGSFLGHRTCTFFDPQQHLSVAVLANGQDAPFMRMSQGVFQVIDFFLKAVGGPTPLRLQKFNVRLANPQVVVELVATDKRIVAFYPEDWSPFTACQELQYVDSTTLKFKHAHPFLAPGEKVTFTRSKGQTNSVRFAGSTLKPLQQY